MIEFQGFGKIARLNRDIIVTEKIDGTNAAIGIVAVEDSFTYDAINDGRLHAKIIDDIYGNLFAVYAQSRKRIIYPGQDNYGFAAYVYDHADTLVNDLGVGLHFGEWWGGGIQRAYGLDKDDKRFSLFNVKRWAAIPFTTERLGVVPVLYTGPFSLQFVNGRLVELAFKGSAAAPGFMRPEGVVIYHTAAKQLFKVTLVGDEKPKGLTTC
ncbi:MAG: RNA ligase family protein [Candidatus Saccharimonadales bacterium]